MTAARQARLRARGFEHLDRAPESVRRAANALVEIDEVIDPAEPLRFAIKRAAAAIDPGRGSVETLLDFFDKRVPGNARSEARYRWELSHRVGVKMPRYAPSEKAWVAWRHGEADPLKRNPFEVEARLLLPIILADNLESLIEAAEANGPDGERARSLLDEATPIARRDVARYIALNDAWEDTFALWCITRASRVLDHLHSLAVALAISYAAGARAPLCGTKYPYYEKPLVSASAQLASSLLALGVDLDVAAELATFVRDQRRASGGWGDDPDHEDPLTTVAAIDLLARTDPTFDLEPTLRYFTDTQHEDGLWRALGPEAPWLTMQVISLLLAAHEPFSERFRWPHCGPSVIDQKTGAPFFAHFLDIARLLTSMPGLAVAPIELAFIDLIGFRAFNNRFGQDAGDEVLKVFATELETVRTARIVRDGGDEFLVIGAPSRSPLFDDLREFMTRWKARFHARFGDDVPAVIPRVVVAQSRGAELRALRERLGREITSLKELASIPETGVIVTSRG